jgi:anaerobic ribonucleoside-triphosphate reductase activating protein
MTVVHLSRIHFPVTTLGPGRRVGIWLQGCSIRCPGCISVDTWDASLGDVPINQVFEILDRHVTSADGLTVSGGEPFDQPDALSAILRQWRSRSGTSVLVFTGHEYERVEPWLKSNPGLVDAVMAEPFRSDLPQTLALRGSDNQRLHLLSPVGAEFAQWDRPSVGADRRLDMMIDESGDAWFAGIPARGDLAKLRRALTAAGHSLQTSDMAEARRRP